ncbi:MAG: radical SAM protein [Pseudomonadota bacterium]
MPVALIYPNYYHVGMSSLGYQAVYSLFNRDPRIVCERVFLPEEGPPLSIESKRSLKDFNIIAFSVSFENDYLNILKILNAAGIPLMAAERREEWPLAVGGGVATFLNPEPLAEFIDCFLLGEAEELLPPFLDIIHSGLLSGERKADMLARLASEMDGAYVPRFYEAAYDAAGRLRTFAPKDGFPEKVKRRSVPVSVPPERHTAVLTPQTEFADKFLIEIGSGCSRGCRFCAAGFIYRPPRAWPEETILGAVDEKAESSEIGLVGVEIADPARMEHLCRELFARGKKISFSSLRADCLTPEILSVLKAAGLKTVTIAPDAGSERMRKVINKGLTEETILQAAERLTEWDILNLKLYFMIGLPTEKAEDVEAIIDLTKKIKDRVLRISRGKKRIGTMTLSINCFVPKPWTPFQWVGMEDLQSLETKRKTLNDGLRREGNVRVTFDVPKWAYLQAIFARGDRRTADFLRAALRTGNWNKAYKEVSLNPDFFVHREREGDELFPWDFIDHGINKSYLREEYEKALKGERTVPCRVGECKRCGVC